MFTSATLITLASDPQHASKFPQLLDQAQTVLHGSPCHGQLQPNWFENRQESQRWMNFNSCSQLPTWCLHDKILHIGTVESNGVEENTSGRQQAMPAVVYWPAMETAGPTFTDKRRHTGTGEQQQFWKPAGTWAATTILLSMPQTRKGFQ